MINDYSGKDFKKFKLDLFETVNQKISKISSEMKRLLSDRNYLDSILRDGMLKANEVASNNMAEIKEIINFYKK